MTVTETQKLGITEGSEASRLLPKAGRVPIAAITEIDRPIGPIRTVLCRHCVTLLQSRDTKGMCIDPRKMDPPHKRATKLALNW